MAICDIFFGWKIASKVHVIDESNTKHTDNLLEMLNIFKSSVHETIDVDYLKFWQSIKKYLNKNDKYLP